MFELTNEEKQELISVNPRLDKLKYSPVVSPMVFTEQGVAMLFFFCVNYGTGCSYQRKYYESVCLLSQHAS